MIIFQRFPIRFTRAVELIKHREIGYKATREIIKKGIGEDLPPLDLKRALARKDQAAK